MRRHKKYRPYIRRINGHEKANSIILCMRLDWYQVCGLGYVLVQHGFPNLALDVAMTKRELKRRPLPVWAGRKSWRQWARDVQKFASGKR